MALLVLGSGGAVWFRMMANEDRVAVVAEVVSAARLVADSSGQIAQGNLELSQRTEVQATTLEETSSSMHELTCGDADPLHRCGSSGLIRPGMALKRLRLTYL